MDLKRFRKKQHKRASSSTHLLLSSLRELTNALGHDGREFVDMETVREQCWGGYRSTEMRKQIWPKLLGTSALYCHPKKHTSNSKKHHWVSKDETQIDLDVRRCMHTFDKAKTFSTNERSMKRRSLAYILNTVVNDYENHSYYQGYHAVCTIFLLVCGETVGSHLGKILARNHFKPYMRDRLDVALQQVKLIQHIMQSEDPWLWKFFCETGAEDLFFTHKWLLTWFSHTCSSFEQMCRFFDVFLAQHPLIPLYCAAQIILDSREYFESIEHPLELYEVVYYFQDMESFDMDVLLSRTRLLVEKYPPAKLSRKLPRSDRPMYPLPWYDTPIRSDKFIKKEIRQQNKQRRRTQSEAFTSITPNFTPREIFEKDGKDNNVGNKKKKGRFDSKYNSNNDDDDAGNRSSFLTKILSPIKKPISTPLSTLGWVSGALSVGMIGLSIFSMYVRHSSSPPSPL
eukprot:TRINITY_DN7163_c0_g1_i1.p1 TRINITY_DN7163_c0_g1~~TRINITY_DN7163_c0_g1_i1.p1  ORF type:complete len:455 (+),score=92.48 TRINITY_DN7163_c0_g1_i1:150-1514(+)